MTQTVNVKYELSQAGQKAALLSGRPATARVAEQLPFDLECVDDLKINTDGSVQYDATLHHQGGYYCSGWTMQLDSPPADLKSLISAHKAHLAKLQAESDARVAKQKAEADARAAEVASDKERDYPIVESLLAEYEALDPLAAMPAHLSSMAYGGLWYVSPSRYITTEQHTRIEAVGKRRTEAAAAAKQAAADAKAAEDQKMIDEQGGFVFAVAGGLCGFRGHNLWDRGQSRRWVGIFTQPKGIAEFCQSPKGEFVFEVSGLNAGDCIQGAGFDTNSRGKRRDETEWFGVVVRRNGEEIVVRICESRAECFKVSRQLQKAEGAK